MVPNPPTKKTQSNAEPLNADSGGVSNASFLVASLFQNAAHNIGAMLTRVITRHNKHASTHPNSRRPCPGCQASLARPWSSLPRHLRWSPCACSVRLLNVMFAPLHAHQTKATSFISGREPAYPAAVNSWYGWAHSAKNQPVGLPSCEPWLVRT